MRQLVDLIENRFPLIKIKPGDKVPAENWEASELRDRDYDEFEGFNVAVKCGTEISEGKYLGIIDIDPRNKGSLKTLEDALGQLPETLCIKTPSNGQHLYFWTKEPIGKCKPFPGIDWQGQGSYCLTVGSAINEKSYEVVIEEDIQELPQNVVDFLNAHRRGATGAVVDLSDWRDKERIGPGERNETLTQMAGSLRSAGFEADELIDALRLINAKRCDPPLDDKDVVTIARSIARYPKKLVSAEQLPKLKEEKKTITVESFKDAAKIERELKSILADCDGLVKDIAHHVLNHCDRQYSSFGLAVALGVLSTAAQGSYSVPHYAMPGKKNGSVSLYNWLIAPSSAGKEAYRSAMLSYITAIDPRLVAPKLGSSYGLRSTLFAFNSQCSVVDEMQDEMDRLGGIKASTYLNQVLTEMKELTNDLDELRPVVIKSTRYPGVIRPRYSVFAVGTIEGLVKHLNAALIGGGLLSRFTIWPVVEVPPRVFQERMQEVPKAQLDLLREIFDHGLTLTGREQDYEQELARFHGVDTPDGKKEKISHKPQTLDAITLDINSKARVMAIDFVRAQEKKYQNYIKDNMAGSDLSPGSIADRAPRTAMKFATLHAIGCTRTEVTEKDMDIGIKLAKVLSDYLCDLILANVGESHADKDMNRIQAFVSRHSLPVSKREISRKVRVRSVVNMDRILIDMVLTGKLIAVDSSGTALDLEGLSKLPRGLSFAIDRS